MHEYNTPDRSAWPRPPKYRNQSLSFCRFPDSSASKFHWISCKNLRLAYIPHPIRPPKLAVRILECSKSTDFNVDSYGSWSHRKPSTGVDGRRFLFAIKDVVTLCGSYTNIFCNIRSVNFSYIPKLGIRIFLTYSFQTGKRGLLPFPGRFACISALKTVSNDRNVFDQLSSLSRVLFVTHCGRIELHFSISTKIYIAVLNCI
jgi:hypothetical protein